MLSGCSSSPKRTENTQTPHKRLAATNWTLSPKNVFVFVFVHVFVCVHPLFLSVEISGFLLNA